MPQDDEESQYLGSKGRGRIERVMKLIYEFTNIDVQAASKRFLAKLTEIYPAVDFGGRLLLFDIFLLPALQNSFAMLSCAYLPSTRISTENGYANVSYNYLRRDTSTVCWDAQHLTWVVIAAILIFVCFPWAMNFQLHERWDQVKSIRVDKAYTVCLLLTKFGLAATAVVGSTALYVVTRLLIMYLISAYTVYAHPYRGCAVPHHALRCSALFGGFVTSLMATFVYFLGKQSREASLQASLLTVFANVRRPRPPDKSVRHEAGCRQQQQRPDHTH